MFDVFFQGFWWHWKFYLRQIFIHKSDNAPKYQQKWRDGSMIMRNIINPPLSSPPPSAKYRAYEEGWHRVFMYETCAREREKKTKKNESMNVHGWNLFGCVCCKFSFKSYKLVEKNTQSENCQRVIKTNFLTGCCFCDINARENKVTFSLYFLFLKTVTVETFEFTPSDHLPAHKNQTQTRNANAKKKKKG